ncbi:MAG: hypothetical protein JNM17_13865 [Archangium sp.]|nr:hypothetical protein [Archangium sp.]
MGFSAFEGADFKFGAPPPGLPIAEQLASWAREAAAARRVACVYLTASWCPPSVKLEKSLGNPLMTNALRGVNFATYDIDDFGNELSAAGFPAHTVPVFFVLDAEGKRTGASITGGAWGENTPENMAPPLQRFFEAARAALPAVSSMPDPALIGAMVANSPVRAQPAPQPVAPQQPQSVSAPPASVMPRLLIIGVLVLIAVVYFATR